MAVCLHLECGLIKEANGKPYDLPRSPIYFFRALQGSAWHGNTVRGDAAFVVKEVKEHVRLNGKDASMRKRTPQLHGLNEAFAPWEWAVGDLMCVTEEQLQ